MAGRQAPARDVGLGQAGLGGRVAGHGLQRLAVLAHGGADAALLELEPAEQRAHVGVLLGHRAAGRHRRAHGGQRAVEVAVQLAEVGHARVGGEVGLAIDHLLQRPPGLWVAPELDEGVDDGAERLDRPRAPARGRAARRAGRP